MESSHFRIFARSRSGGNKLSNVRRFINLRSGEGLTSFYKDDGANFSGEKSTIKLSRVSIFGQYAKKTLNHKSNLVVVLVLESKGL